MKTRNVALAMMTLMLSTGPLMAMDSQYQESQRKALQEESTGVAMQADSSNDQQREDGQHLREDGAESLTQEALRFWWL
ncbi:hypothetical protein IOC61_16895 [Halomonas sp. KAO]|uniref:hypothetical protein n=1 Tax=unclassified Halomonas TaxID=2609666 RepID=UPI00189FEC1B|nr:MULTISPECIES: hypothetical protein [unclassified Halomonas]MBF7054979.1 hypothetical protein [Halomonas sp. KAO]MDT0501433.1 hypothetical protein [Halomonas sp. PAR7]MDT0512893.1 hypothetical protein [Halomonas sp. LES1]MDT0591282.1 hypothetical protein [Halomonas sp. PAR8]